MPLLIRTLDTRTSDVAAELRKRSAIWDLETQTIVAGIISDVRNRGDAALLDSARRFDSPEVTSVRVSLQELEEASISAEQEDALRTAYERVHRFHQGQLWALTAGWQVEMSRPGRTWRDGTEERFVGQRMLSLPTAGVYVPGGNAAYPSSVLMNALPALVAGVGEVAVTTPARKDGSLPESVRVALRLCGISRVYKVGGAAAIAALALGTESIARVSKVVGPGNRFVNEAKRQLWGQVGVDGYAGPSEVCVLADVTANAAYAAADLLTQVEHAPDNSAFLVSPDEEKLNEILAEVEKQLSGAPREATMRTALAGKSLAIVARDMNEAIALVDEIAPEHLSLAVADPESILGRIRNAGCILMGELTPESGGDYCFGPSHTLPTSGAARWQSPVNVADFLKFQSLVRMDRAGLEELIPTIESLAHLEGFPAHANGATIRRREHSGEGI